LSIEAIATRARQIELTSRRVPFRREVACDVIYKRRQLRREYHVDFVCYDEVVIEVKARSNTGPADHAQVISYLASTKLQVGLLINFGAAKLEYRRFVRTAGQA
jgi:GxxExxY protein